MTWANLSTETQHQQFLDPSVKSGTSFSGVDPHLLWAGVSYLAFADSFAGNPIPVMFEVERDELDKILAEPCPIVNLTPGSDNLFGNFYTGFVKPRNLRFLIHRVDRLRIAGVDLPSTENLGEPQPSLKVVKRHANPESVVIGIIDHGIGFANRHFAAQDKSGNWASRIERLWDQQRGYPAKYLKYLGVNPKMNWRSTEGFGYGRELVNTGRYRRIDAWMNSNILEHEIYQRMRYLPAQGAVTHGTHVLGLMAGNRAYGTDTHNAPVQAMDDEASRAPIIAVQLPAIPYKDTSGAGLCMQILDAISYIHLHAAGRKVVINLSDGSYAGPHDGTSMLERALDEFYLRNNHRSAFVVSAGNQFNERVHWADTVPAKDSVAGLSQITWNVLPDDKTDSHLEIWPSAKTPVADLKKLSVFITPPGRQKLGPVKFGEAFAYFENSNVLDEPAVFMTAFIEDHPNSFTPNVPRAMIHIALSATRPKPSSGREAPPHGIWIIELANDSGTPIPFNAYIERDNPALGDTGPSRQSHFVHPAYPRNSGIPAYQRNSGMTDIFDDSANPSPVKRMGILNNVATAAEVFVVGGVRLNIDTAGNAHPELASYSAAGPGRNASAQQQGPDILAPSDMSYTIRGIRGLGTRSGMSVRMDGTSVAAPMISRRLVNLMANGALANASKNVLLTGANNAIAGPIERIGKGLA